MRYYASESAEDGVVSMIMLTIAPKAVALARGCKLSVQYKNASGVPKDEPLHEPILSAVNFNCTAAYANALKRYMELGLTEQEAKELFRKQ